MKIESERHGTFPAEVRMSGLTDASSKSDTLFIAKLRIWGHIKVGMWG